MFAQPSRSTKSPTLFALQRSTTRQPTDSTKWPTWLQVSHISKTRFNLTLLTSIPVGLKRLCEQYLQPVVGNDSPTPADSPRAIDLDNNFEQEPLTFALASVDVFGNKEYEDLQKRQQDAIKHIKLWIEASTGSEIVALRNEKIKCLVLSFGESCRVMTLSTSRAKGIIADNLTPFQVNCFSLKIWALLKSDSKTSNHPSPVDQ